MYERMAGEYLCGIGCEILEYNYYTSYGEIDIIAKDGVCIVFVEVKYRKNANFGLPREAVNFQKQNKLRLVATSYIRKYRLLDKQCRFDVIEILGKEITHIKDAF